MRWSLTFSDAENRLLDKCEKEKRLNPYQPETLEKREPKGLADIDSSSEDSSGTDESNELEEPNYGEVTTNPDRALENQPNKGSSNLLGNKFHIIENRSWEDNYLLQDYLNLEKGFTLENHDHAENDNE